MDDPRPRTADDRIVELDALRGIAAVAVMLYHYTDLYAGLFPTAATIGWRASWGCYGVQLFFAISGFVILMSLERHRDVGGFLRSRIRRLFPLFWLAIALTTVIVQGLGPSSLQPSASAALLNMTMMPLPLGAKLVDGSYWSLSVELSFYAGMAIALRLDLLRRVEWVMVGWIGLTWLWWCVPSLSARLGFVLIQDHIPWFAIGVLAWRVRSGARRWDEQLPFAAVVIGTIIVIDPIQPRWIALGLAILFGSIAVGRMRWLAMGPLMTLGALSYPLYLVHQYVGYTLMLRLDDAGVAPGAALLVAIGVALMLARLLLAAERIVTAPAILRHRWQLRTT